MLVTPAHTSELYLVEIKANSLNVRETPSVKGTIVDSLVKGQIVYASPVGNDWAMVFVDGKMKGYGAFKYMTIKSKVSSSEKSAEEGSCKAESAQLQLEITSVDFRCKEDLFGNEFESCSAWFDVSLSTSCSEDFEAYVDCNAEFTYETKDGFLPKRTASRGLESVFINYGHGSARIQAYWKPNLIFDELMKVKLSDASCSISSVYEY